MRPLEMSLSLSFVMIRNYRCEGYPVSMILALVVQLAAVDDCVPGFMAKPLSGWSACDCWALKQS